MKEKDHEGYSAPTAGLAVKRVFRKARYRRKRMPQFRRLAFRLGDLECFKAWVELSGNGVKHDG